MELMSLIVFAGMLTVAAASPGPNVAAIVGRVLSKGHKGVMPFIAGLWVGDAVWLSLAVWGLAALAQSFNVVFILIKYMGVAYLLYFAWKMWTAPVGGGEQAELPKTREGGKLFMSGVAITLGNPKIMLFYVAVLPTIIDLSNVSLIGWSQLIIVMFSVLAAVDLGWVFLAAQAQRFLKTPKAIRIVNRVSAGLVAGAAAAIAAK